MARPVVAIVQSSYIPWKGYFDLIAASDIFVLFDDAQFTKRDWRNRNRIKTAQGSAWLTIPVITKGRFDQAIDEVEISDHSWAEKHWRTVSQAYARAPFYTDYGNSIEGLFEEATSFARLSEVNRHFLTGICEMLSIDANFLEARKLSATGSKTDRLLDICEKLRAKAYFSGPSARMYMEPGKFDKAGVALHYINYANYPSYEQLHGAFDPHVSILDLIFMLGPDARGHLSHAAPR